MVKSTRTDRRTSNGTPHGAWDYDDITRSVSSDLTAVFGAEAQAPQTSCPTAAPQPAGAAQSRAAPAGLGAARIGAIIAAGLIGLAGGLALSHMTTPDVTAQAPVSDFGSRG